MRTLKNKLVTSAKIITMGIILNGCGALYDHPFDRWIIENVVPEGLQTSRMKEVRKEWKEERTAREFQIPNNVICSNKKCNPAEGYAWVNPKDKNDLSVKESIFSYEIKNLNTQKIEIRVMSEKDYSNYIIDQFKNGKFPKKGYYVTGYQDERPSISMCIKDVKKEGNKFKIISEC